LQQKVCIPPQEFKDIRLENTGKAIGVAVLIGWFASFLPGLGPAQAAVLGSELVELSERGFLILVGGLSTVNMVLSLVTFYVLDKARNGAVVAVSELVSLGRQDFLIFLCVALTSGGLATLLAIRLSKVFSSFISKVNYQKVCLSVIALIVVLVLLLSGWLGFLVLLVSAAVGIIPAAKNVSRSHMMACLLVPVMGYFLF
jgi:putative membrane protein